jgi:nudix-type nucleoside diphosphatase (YffH/AdpP family)
MIPTILERETVYTGYLTVERLKVKLADGAQVWRDVQRHGDAAAVLPYDARRRCALVVQLFRAPVFDACGEASTEEACAGMVDSETPEAAARREAMEEMGVSLHTLEFVARVWSSPGVCTERQSLFLAPYGVADRKNAGGGVPSEHEGITTRERSLTHLAAAAEQGHIVDAKLLALVLALQVRRPDLFAS